MSAPAGPPADQPRAASLAEIGRAWSRFWLAPSPGRAESLFRVAYAAVLLPELLGLGSKLDLLFSTAGMHPATALDAAYSPELVRAVHGLWLAAGLCLLVGLRVRIAAAVNLACASYFFGLRGAVAPHAADWLLQSMAFYLLLMKCDRCFSVERALGWRREFRPAAVWPKRLAQLNVLFVYFTAGISKLGDPHWMAGLAFRDTLRHPLLPHHHLGGVIEQVGLLTFANYAVIVWEIAFPLLMVPRWLRPWALLSALAFLLSIDLTLRVGWFTAFASASLLLFVDDLPWWRPRPLVASPGAPRLRWLVHGFLVWHLVLFGTSQAGYALLALGQREAARRVLGFPPVHLYTTLVARTAYFNVWPSGLFLSPVRLLVYQAREADGSLSPVPPFDAEGGFAPSLRFYREAREGLLAFRLATAGASRQGWEAYVRQILRRYQEVYGDRCPAEIRIDRIVAPLDAFGDRPQRLAVPRSPVLTAHLRCDAGEVGVRLSFPPER